MVHSTRLAHLSSVLEEDMASKTERRIYRYKTTGRVEYDEFYMKLSKDIIDEIDRELARLYDFTAEELDFIQKLRHKIPARTVGFRPSKLLLIASWGQLASRMGLAGIDRGVRL